jgi:phenylacetate-coenzyme A ligase PaaK-like adenylate-forming protein
VLLTNLANRVQPLVRYDLGDSVVAEADPCPCGSPLPTVRVQGRCDDVLRFTDTSGREVALAPLALGAVMDQSPGVRRSQLLMTSPRTLVVRLDTEPGADPDRTWEAVRSALARHLAAHHVSGVDLLRDAVPPQQTPGGKVRQVSVASGT